MFNLFIFLYCNINTLLKEFYFSNFEIGDTKDILIKNNDGFYYAFTSINGFILILYSFYLYYYIFVSKIKSKYTLSLASMYIKYTYDLYNVSNNLTLYDYECRRITMWVFITPIMLQLYCDVNKLKLTDIHFNYHFIPCFLNVVIYPFRTNVYINNTFTCISIIPIILFIKQLYSYYNLRFTKVYFAIWMIFSVLNCLDFFKLIDIFKINLLYLIADMIGKILTTFVIHDHLEQQHLIQENMDLQSLNFVSYLLVKIKEYNINNVNQTIECQNFVQHINNRVSSFIPEDKQELQIELLKKILPLGLEDKYVSGETNSRKEFNNICVLFTDIVSYTELANKYDDKTIFELLNNVYNLFDTLIQKYQHLQKIETIGDAYMVVGDIFRPDDNSKVVIKEIIELGIEFIDKVKMIHTPDKTPLCMRIGINIGSVIVGILGNELPRLCVVGNTVNMSARLQSTADKDTIQLSSEIYEIIKKESISFNSNIDFELKENVFLKNIGSVNTYNIYPNLNNFK